MNNKAVRAVRQGMVLAMPLLMIGAFVTIFQTFPLKVYQDFINRFAGGALNQIYACAFQVTMGFFALAVAGTISFCYTQEYCEELPRPYVLVIVSMAAFFASSGMDASHLGDYGSELGVRGMIFAIATSLLACFMFRKLYAINWMRLEGFMYGFNTHLKESVSYIIPSTIVIVTFAAFNCFLYAITGVSNINEWVTGGITRIFAPLGDSYTGVVVILIAAHLFFLVGINGLQLVSGFMQGTIYSGALLQICGNLSQSPDTVEMCSRSFFSTFILIGGCGGCLSLAIGLLFYSSQTSMKSLTKICFFGSLFNIDDMLVYGIPIVFNRFFAIPFVVTPLVFFLTSCLAFGTGLVPPISASVGWTTPVIINAYIATGSIRGVLLQVFNVLVGILIYRPFIKWFDHRTTLETIEKIELVKQDVMECEKYGQPTSFLKRNDDVADVAKTLCKDLEFALHHNGISLYYQPQTHEDGKCFGAEALIRWKHREFGFIYPPMIIALAKESGQLSELEEFIFDRACHDLKYLNDEIDATMKISVNITGQSLANEGLEDIIHDAVTKYQINPKNLWIEITEQDAISLTPEIHDRLVRIKNMGHRLIIDDFGMGHTSILYLQSNQFDVVKLDGELTRHILENPRDAEIISSITNLGKNLNFTIIAEYIEDEVQRKKLCQLGCTGFQGYLISRPVRFFEFVDWIQKS